MYIKETMIQLGWKISEFHDTFSSPKFYVGSVPSLQLRFLCIWSFLGEWGVDLVSIANRQLVMLWNFVVFIQIHTIIDTPYEIIVKANSYLLTVEAITSKINMWFVEHSMKRPQR